MLGKDDFLKLLVGELQNMDPMSQSNDPTQSMEQMTQFSMLEQLTNLSTSQDALAANEKQSQAISLIGKTVDYTDSRRQRRPVAASTRSTSAPTARSASLSTAQTGVSPAAVSGVR